MPEPLLTGRIDEKDFRFERLPAGYDLEVLAPKCLDGLSPQPFVPNVAERLIFSEPVLLEVSLVGDQKARFRILEKDSRRAVIDKRLKPILAYALGPLTRGQFTLQLMIRVGRLGKTTFQV